MVKLLSSIILILAIILFPPAVLALVSNNAVPGDATYPIKRFLEDRIYNVASINPNTKAWFAAARSDRRFTEVKVLINSGKQAKTTLRELVTQAETTVSEISKVEDPTRKNQLLDQYKETVEEYKKGLEELKQQAISAREVEEVKKEPQPTETSLPTAIPDEPSPTSKALPAISTPTPVQRATPTPTRKPTPTSIPIATRIPTLSPTPTPTVSAPTTPTDPDDIEDAIDDLDEIVRKAEEEKKTDDQNSTQLSPTPTPQVTSGKIRLFSTNRDTGSTAPQTLLTPTPILPSPTVCPIPPKPSGLSYISDSKTVSWDAVASASYYNVRLVTPDSDQHNFGDITNTWYTFPDDLVVAPGTYSWWVDAINECGVDREGSSFTIGLP